MRRKDGSPDRRFKANKGSAVFTFVAAGVGIALMDSFSDVSAGCMFIAAGGAAGGLLF